MIMLKRIGWLLVVIAGCCTADASAQPKPDEGIPVQSELVRSRCGSCHKADDKMRMTRISYRRASPENWEKTIKRMVSLNHVNLEPADAPQHPQHLSDHNGLAPEEVASDRVRGRAPDDRLHLPGRQGHVGHLLAVPHDRARDERAADQGRVGLLVDMHRGYYPLVDNQPMNGGQGFRRTRPAADRARRRRPAARTTVIRWRRRSSTCRRRIR